MTNTATDSIRSTVSTIGATISATLTATTEVYSVTSPTGISSGYAARRLGAETFSLNAENGMDLMASPSTLAQAIAILVAYHEAEARSRG